MCNHEWQRIYEGQKPDGIGKPVLECVNCHATTVQVCQCCNEPIEAYELCDGCAAGNDPFQQSKYSYGARGPY